MDSREAQSVRTCLAELDQTERYVVLMFFADELTAAEIGLVLDLPAPRVTDILDAFRQMVGRLLEKATGQSESLLTSRRWFGSTAAD